MSAPHEAAEKMPPPPLLLKTTGAKKTTTRSLSHSPTLDFSSQGRKLDLKLVGRKRRAKNGLCVFIFLLLQNYPSGQPASKTVVLTKKVKVTT